MNKAHHLVIVLDKETAIKFKTICVEKNISMTEAVKRFINHTIKEKENN